jgi:hypothetical protein
VRTGAYAFGAFIFPRDRSVSSVTANGRARSPRRVSTPVEEGPKDGRGVAVDERGRAMIWPFGGARLPARGERWQRIRDEPRAFLVGAALLLEQPSVAPASTSAQQARATI